jgi:hypothetical protein
MRRRLLCCWVRRDLLWFIPAFALIQLGLAWTVEHRLPDVRDPEYTAKEQRLRALRAARPHDPMVLMLGSSRASMGLRAADLSQDGAFVFNAALSGGGPMLELTCLRRLLAAGLRPDMLLVEVVPYHFNRVGEETLEELILSGARLRRSELAAIEDYCEGPERLGRQWWKARLLPGVQQQAELRDHIGLDSFTCRADADLPLVHMDDHGWHPRYLESDPARQQREEERALQKYAPYAQHFRLAEKPARALTDLLAACRSAAVPVTLVLMPEDSRFRAADTPEVRAGTDRFFAGVQAHWQVPVVDARDWVRDGDFWDGHHLLPAGAAAFTRRLAESALRPALRDLSIQGKQAAREIRVTLPR